MTILPQPPLLKRMTWWTTLYAIKLLVLLQRLITRIKGPHPSICKTYRGLPGKAYVFLPPDYKKSDAPLPLLFMIHGGGWCIGHPIIDFNDAVILAKYGIAVVCVGYPLAPRNKFPGPVHNVARMIEAVFADTTLPIDREKVAISGYSAGGNLALVVPSLNDMHKRIKGVVAYYPATDVARPMAKKLETAIAPPGEKDILLKLSPIFRWGYLPKNADIDLKDPLLSPLYADRAAICDKVYIIGCEYDMLCTEGEETAEAYAEAERKLGRGGNRRELEEGRVGWVEGNVMWEKLLGVEHGFNQRGTTVSSEKRRLWELKTKDMHKNVAEWLFREVYI